MGLFNLGRGNKAVKPFVSLPSHEQKVLEAIRICRTTGATVEQATDMVGLAHWRKGEEVAMQAAHDEYHYGWMFQN